MRLSQQRCDRSYWYYYFATTTLCLCVSVCVVRFHTLSSVNTTVSRSNSVCVLPSSDQRVRCTVLVLRFTTCKHMYNSFISTLYSTPSFPHACLPKIRASSQSSSRDENSTINAQQLLENRQSVSVLTVTLVPEDQKGAATLPRKIPSIATETGYLACQRRSYCCCRCLLVRSGSDGKSNTAHSEFIVFWWEQQQQ